MDRSPAFEAKIDQAGAALRDLSEMLATFRDHLVDHDFSVQAAEQMADTMLASYMLSGST